MDDDPPRGVGELRHLSESVLYAFVHGDLASLAAAEVADHLEQCLACRVWAARLRQATVSEPDERIISRLVDASAAVPQALQQVLTTGTSDTAPDVGQLWRVGREEAMLVWVRRVFDDSAAVLPVTFDTDLADELSLIVPDDQSPLGIELVVMCSVDAEVGLGAFLQPVAMLPVDEQVATLRESRRSGLDVPAGLRVGAPIVSEQDQRIEYRQVLSDLLADMSPDAFTAGTEVEPTDDGLDVQQFIEELRAVTWHRNDLTVRAVRLAHLAIDATHGLVLVGLVEYLDVVVPVAVLVGPDPTETLTSPQLASACGALLAQHPAATAVAVAIPDPDWTTVVIERAFATPALETPSGRLSPPRVSFQPLRLVDGLLKYLDGQATRWERIEAATFHTGSLDMAELASTYAAQAIERTVAEGNRAHIPAKRSAYTSLGDREASQIAELIEAVIAPGASPSAAVEQLLDGPHQ
jgi:hypothetical protein